MLDRRHLIKGAGAGILALGSGTAFGSFGALALDTVTMPFENGERPLVKYPQKRPMIGLTSRPPQLETPFSVFDEGAITPNDAFFVRYHLAGIPLNIDPDTFAVEIKGKVDKPVKLSLQELKQLDAVELVACEPMLGQQPRICHPARRRRTIGQRRDGQCALEGRGAQSRSRQGRHPAGRAPGHVQRPRRTDQRQDTGLRQGARHRPCARRRGDARLRHERTGSAGTQRLPPSAHRARLLRHLLGQAPERNHRHRRRVRRLLDEDGLSRTGQRVRLRGARHGAESNHSHQPPGRAFVHHQRQGRREGESRQRDFAQRHRIRRRLRHRRSRGLDRRRKELGGSDARGRPRQIFLPRMAAPGEARSRQSRSQGESA